MRPQQDLSKPNPTQPPPHTPKPNIQMGQASLFCLKKILLAFQKSAPQPCGRSRMDPIHRGKGATELKMVSRTVGQISLQLDNSDSGFHALKLFNFASALSCEIKSNSSSIFGG